MGSKVTQIKKENFDILSFVYLCTDGELDEKLWESEEEGQGAQEEEKKNEEKKTNKRKT